MVYPLLMGLSIRDAAAHQRVSAMGVFQAVYGLGMFLGPVLCGVISDRAGLAWTFWLLGALAVASAAIAARQLPGRNLCLKKTSVRC